ncbi:L-lactate permease [Paraburkholderia aspalathi]|uniref:L-lactate permease n=1 Tax=Paraburkholderia aspalathi TaxID=1324617 RepID=UPI00190B4C4F|nr:L-lactate permease [Paraburkholderia aspalathi]MBK3844103.1 L-lactate permease [Paraburkholderia aspalathi]CAE6867050.1 L-lactate permease [Paraburkholderia aspalathi]CAE6868932.1 L-lactate permease [Paraburkholderia aspalathi]
MYTQIFDPVAHSIGASAAFAALPLLTLFVLLGVLRLQARWAALAALAVSMTVAIFVYGMPANQTASGALEGASIGFFPIIWIGINAIWLFKLTQESGHADVLRRALARVSADQRVQAVLIAFCFGALLEALAGGGAPVAICAVLLISIGIEPLKAAAVCLIADTSPVAFGALGLPITVLAKITHLPVHEISVMVGRQTPLLSLFIPLILVFIVDGRRGMKEVWPLALVTGVVFALGQFAGSMLLPVELVDIVAALICAGISIAFLRVWSPGVLRADLAGAGTVTATANAGGQQRFDANHNVAGVSHSASMAMPMPGSGTHFHHTTGRDHAPAGTTQAPDSRAEILRALAPYAAVILVVASTQISLIGHALGAITSMFPWPGLHVVDPKGVAVSAVNAKFEWLLSAGSIVLIAGLLSAPVLKVSAAVATRTYLKNLHELRWAVFTVCCVVGVAYVMNLSGQIVTLGIFAAKAGPAFAPVSPILGWFATALTGSDTSANALFGMLQLTTAHHTGLSDILLTAANTSGGVVGKAISPQNLAVGAVAVGMMGKEGVLFRRVVGWTVLMISALSLLVYLQSTPVLGWMVP